MARRLEKKRNEELDKLNPDEEVDQVAVTVTEIVDEEEESSFKVIKEVLDSDLIEDNEEALFSKFLPLGLDWADEYLDSKGKSCFNHLSHFSKAVLINPRYRVMEMLRQDIVYCRFGQGV